MKLSEYLKDFNDFNFFYIRGVQQSFRRGEDAWKKYANLEVTQWHSIIGSNNLACPLFCLDGVPVVKEVKQ